MTLYFTSIKVSLGICLFTISFWTSVCKTRCYCISMAKYLLRMLYVIWVTTTERTSTRQMKSDLLTWIFETCARNCRLGANIKYENELYNSKLESYLLGTTFSKNEISSFISEESLLRDSLRCFSSILEYNICEQREINK